MSTRRKLFALVTMFGTVLAYPVCSFAFDTTPWSSVPFGTSSGMTAAALATVAGAQARANALGTATAGTGVTVSSGAVTVGGPTCVVNVGGANATINSAVSTFVTTVTGNIITICQ
jgi:hypothetical protein